MSEQGSLISLKESDIPTSDLSPSRYMSSIGKGLGRGADAEKHPKKECLHALTFSACLCAAPHNRMQIGIESALDVRKLHFYWSIVLCKRLQDRRK